MRAAGDREAAPRRGGGEGRVSWAAAGPSVPGGAAARGLGGCCCLGEARGLPAGPGCRRSGAFPRAPGSAAPGPAAARPPPPPREWGQAGAWPGGGPDPRADSHTSGKDALWFYKRCLLLQRLNCLTTELIGVFQKISDPRSVLYEMKG